MPKTTIVSKYIGILFLIISLSCKGNNISQKESIKSKITTLGCSDYLSILKPVGIFCNNVWNKHAANDFNWSQCIESRIINGKTEYGWSWNWPEKSTVIYAQPQLKIGRSPWEPTVKTDVRFPMQIAQLKNFKLSYKTTTSTNGDFNLTTTLWMTHTPITSNKTDTSIIAAEFMIWSYATENHFNPAGKKYGEFKTKDTIWEVWADKNWGDTSGIHKNKWINVTYKSKKQSLSAEINIQELIDHAVKEKIIDANFYIADLELGNEIKSGKGITWLHSFKVDLE